MAKSCSAGSEEGGKCLRGAAVRTEAFFGGGVGLLVVFFSAWSGGVVRGTSPSSEV